MLKRFINKLLNIKSLSSDKLERNKNSKQCIDLALEGKLSNLSYLYGLRPGSFDEVSMKNWINSQGVDNEKLIDDLIARAQEFEPQLKSVLKSAGLTKSAFLWMPIEGSIEHSANCPEVDMKSGVTTADIERQIRRFLSADQYAAEERLNRLLDWGRLTDEYMTVILGMKSVEKKARKAAQRSKGFEELSEEQRAEINKKDLSHGHNIHENSAIQLTQNLRRLIWTQYPQNIELLATVTLEEAAAAFLKSGEMLYLRRRLANKNKRTKRSLQVRTHNISISQNTVSTKENNIKVGHTKLQKLRNIIQEDILNLQEEIKFEQAQTEQNENYYREQGELLKITLEELITSQKQARKLEESKKQKLDLISQHGAEIEDYETSPYALSLFVEVKSSPFRADSRTQQHENSFAMDWDDAQLRVYEQYHVDLCNEIRMLQQEYNKQLETYLPIKHLNNSLSDHATQMERETAKSLKKITSLAELKRDLEVEIAQLEYLLMDVRSGLDIKGVNSEYDYPSDIIQLEGWLKEKPYLVIPPKTLKHALKVGYAKPELLFAALDLLNSEYRERKLSSGDDREQADEKREAYKQKLNSLRLSEGGSITRLRNQYLDDQYKVTWKGEKYFLNKHLRNGVSRQHPERCLCIYYTDLPDGRVLVGHLPNHLATTMG